MSTFSRQDHLSSGADHHYREVSVLLRDQEHILSLAELRVALLSLRSYLETKTNAQPIIKTGKPPTDLSQAGYWTRRLAPLYPDAEILTRSEQQMLRVSARKRLFKLKLDVLSALINALESSDPESVWRNCEPILAHAPQGDEARSYLALDRYYLALGLKHSHWFERARIAHPGGLTDILELMWHVERELSLGTYTKVREALPSSFIEILPSGKPKLSHLAPISLDAAADYVRSKRLLHYPFWNDDQEHAERWAVFLCWVHESLGIYVPGLRPKTVVSETESVTPVFDTTEHTVKRLCKMKFAPSPSYQRVLFLGEILNLTPGEGQVVRVLYEDDGLRKTLHDGWASEDDILIALKHRKLVSETRDTLRDTLSFRPTEGGKKRREPREALAKKLLLFREKEGVPQYRLNL